MLTYNYRCEKCDKEYEIEQRITDKKLEECQVCGSKDFKRLISKPSTFVLNGGGWYADGYEKKQRSDIDD